MCVAGFVWLRAAGPRRQPSRPTLALLAAPLLAAVFTSTWYFARVVSGDCWAAAFSFITLDVTGIRSDPPPTRGRATRYRNYWKKRVVKLFFVLFVVVSSLLLILLADRFDNPAVCTHWSTANMCWLKFSVRVVVKFCIDAYIAIGIICAGALSKPGLQDVLSPTTWWMGAAGASRQLAIVALFVTHPLALRGFSRTGSWLLAIASLTLAMLLICQCFAQVVGIRQSSWPTVCKAIGATWIARLHLEILPLVDASHQIMVKSAMIAYAYLLGGFAAGISLLPDRFFAGEGDQPQRNSCSRRFAGCLKICSGCLGILFVSALAWFLRDSHAAYLIERLFVISMMSSAASGFSHLWLTRYISLQRCRASYCFGPAPQSPGGDAVVR
jgi:hypothetical protein